MAHPDDTTNRETAPKRGDDAGIQSPTTTGGDLSDERPTSPVEGPVTDAERLEVKGEVVEGERS